MMQAGAGAVEAGAGVVQTGAGVVQTGAGAVEEMACVPKHDHCAWQICERCSKICLDI